ncbi:LPO_1073/Vpar_1526 family protein [Providencia manganoxydans]|uniref:LPO_1073/Vpar_1526 family protein n=1 Tax=Providencia manganoxydans TaxID=2923283 RepID=UPI0032DB18E5
MSLLDKSKQLVGDNSTALQAGGNVTIVFSTGEEAIKDLVARTLESQMPSLREEAKKQVDKIASTFGAQIINRLAQEAESVVIEKLKSPDIQYQINQSIMQVARKGISVKSDSLRELIAKKILTNDEGEDLLIDHAFEIMPRLTIDSVKLLSIIYYLRYWTPPKRKAIITKETSSKQDYSYAGYNQKVTYSTASPFYHDIQGEKSYLLKLVGSLDALKPINLDMLGIIGCTIAGTFYDVRYTELFNKHNPSIPVSDETIHSYYSTLFSIMQKFGIDNISILDRTTLSPLGEIIAQAYLDTIQ